LLGRDHGAAEYDGDQRKLGYDSQQQRGDPRIDEQPMSQLAALGSILNRPLLLAGIGALALAAWGLVTFLAVRFAILSASRAYPKAERPLTV
jgi:hypothetical protein